MILKYHDEIKFKSNNNNDEMSSLQDTSNKNTECLFKRNHWLFSIN